MSGVEQFTAAVPERSGPTDWRGGLEGSGARRPATAPMSSHNSRFRVTTAAPPPAAEKG